MQFFQNVEGAIAGPNIPKAIGRGFGSAFQLVIQAQDLDQLNVYTASLLNKLRDMTHLLNERNSKGQLIQLGSVITRSETTAPNAIEHYNRLRSTTISASLNGVKKPHK